MSFAVAFFVFVLLALAALCGFAPLVCLLVLCVAATVVAPHSFLFGSSVESIEVISYNSLLL